LTQAEEDLPQFFAGFWRQFEGEIAAVPNAAFGIKYKGTS
jgi:hypothetical protein